MGNETATYQQAYDEFGAIDLNNRKYLGSKYRLLDFIEAEILSRVPRLNVFVDGFSGTGVVADRFRRHAKQLIVNDHLYANYAINRTFFCSDDRTTRCEYVVAVLRELNRLQPIAGYAMRSYGGTYFTRENAGRIDAVREEIAARFGSGECSEQEQFLLIASLLFAIDKVANTVGQYDAYLKNLGASTYANDGTHRVDSNVYKRLTLRMPCFERTGDHVVLRNDLNTIVDRYPADVLYLDPPYSSRQYVDNYHVLENIARWNKPVLTGKTRKFDRTELKSAYSKRSSAHAALTDVVDRAKTRFIALSYNNEGILSFDEIEKILVRKGPTEFVDATYNVFGNGAGQSVRRHTIERLFICRVERAA